MISDTEKIKNQLQYWRDNPIEFIKFFWPDDIIWSKLEDICHSVRDNRATVVPSGHGVGKSYISAKIAIWWLFTHYPSKIITTAPTWTQVQSVLWGEIRRSMFSAKVDLTDKKDILQTEIKLAPDWFAQGISTSENVAGREFGSTKFQGFHSPNLLIIMDEAPGVDFSIHTAVETLVTGKNNTILKIGNPTSPTGNFYDNCYSSNWNKVTISCFDHPNVKEGKELISGAVTMEWIDRMREEWGEGSPLWKAKVLGEFPDETDDTLIPLSWCETATETEVRPSPLVVLGVDPARYGDDKTVAYEIKNNVAQLKFSTTKESTMENAGRIATIHDGYNTIYVDGTGVGGGLIDRLREVMNDTIDPNDRQGHKVVEVHFGHKPLNPDRFYNLKAEMFWLLRERLRPDAPLYKKIRIPKDDELINQLASIKIKYTSDGRLQIESKDDMKKRGLKSPDKADALAIASWANRYEKPEHIAQNPIFKEFFAYKRSMKRKPISKFI